MALLTTVGNGAIQGSATTLANADIVSELQQRSSESDED